mmetsp:Transcript_11101/g.16181  ORF Transcript_11101/g.16181 Transcript_11101/m.16181 type:complete len:221 (-) Transcript_11101:141-803(-)
MAMTASRKCKRANALFAKSLQHKERETWQEQSSSATPNAALNAMPASPLVRTSTKSPGASIGAGLSPSMMANPVSGRSRSPVCIVPMHPAWPSVRWIASIRPTTVWCCTPKTSALAVAIAFTRAPLARRNIRRQAALAAVARWTNAPSAPVALRRTTPMRSSPNMAATGSLKASCRSVPRCAPPRRFWRATETWSPTSTASAWWHGALAPAPGAGAQPMS